MAAPRPSAPRRGRPLTPVDANTSNAARLGAEIRARREQRGLTLEAMARLIRFSRAHVSAVERAQTPVSEQFVASCDEALNADGALLALLPSVIYERAADRHRNQARRRDRACPIETGDAIPDEPQAAPAVGIRSPRSAAQAPREHRRLRPRHPEPTSPSPSTGGACSMSSLRLSVCLAPVQ